MILEHIYHKHKDGIDEQRTIFFNSKARYDSLSKLEREGNTLIEHYSDREDKYVYFLIFGGIIIWFVL